MTGVSGVQVIALPSCVRASRAIRWPEKLAIASCDSVPASAADHLWIAASGGAYSTASSRSPTTVPIQRISLDFNLAKAYCVNFVSAPATPILLERDVPLDVAMIGSPNVGRT